MQISVKKEIHGLDILKHFGYRTSMKGYQPSPRLRVLNNAVTTGRENAHWLALSNHDAKKSYMALMETYPHLFDGDGVDCARCDEPILVPLDLRRDGGANYHGVCYRDEVCEEVKERKLHVVNPSNLEQRLKISRVCTPKLEEPLTEKDLEIAKNREELENLYWTGNL